MRFLDVVGEIFWFGIPATPLLAFLNVRKTKLNLVSKILVGLSITLVLTAIFYLVAIGIFFRNGLGPDSVY